MGRSLRWGGSQGGEASRTQTSQETTRKNSNSTHSLFVFLRDDPQQNGVKLLTPVSDLVFYALSDGAIHFALYGSSLNHNLIG